MSRKLRFKPEITRVKLNPEQAVLICDCCFGEIPDELGTPNLTNVGLNICQPGGEPKEEYGYFCTGTRTGDQYRTSKPKTSTS